MKKLFYSLALLLCGLTFMTSCSDDDDKDLSLEKTIYTQANGLRMTYSGSPMLGKTVEFTPAADYKTATLVLKSTLDLSDLPNVPDMLKQPIAGPGVIPGSPVTTLEVQLAGTADNATFAGTSENQYCTFSYSGSVSDEGLVFNVSDVKLKNKALCGIWNLCPRIYDEDNGEVLSETAHIVWDSSAKLNVLGMEMPMDTILKLLMVLPVIEDGEENVDITTMLNKVLRNVDFKEDGNIVANYLDMENQLAGYTNSPLNMAQYVVNGSGNLLLFLNAQAIMYESAKADVKVRANSQIDLDNVLANVLSQLLPMFSEGIPLHYTMQSDALTVYIGGDILIPLLKNNVLPLLKNPAVLEALKNLVSSNPDLEGIAESLPAIVESVAEVIEGTTNIEIGLNFRK